MKENIKPKNAKEALGCSEFDIFERMLELKNLGYEALKRYCQVANVVSLRYLADEFALRHEDAEWEIVCEMIEQKGFADKKLTEAYCKKHAITNDGNGTQEALKTDQEERMQSWAWRSWR